jgi:hypothetical protein
MLPTLPIKLTLTTGKDLYLQPDTIAFYGRWSGNNYTSIYVDSTPIQVLETPEEIRLLVPFVSVIFTLTFGATLYVNPNNYTMFYANENDQAVLGLGYNYVVTASLQEVYNAIIAQAATANNSLNR